MSDDDLNLPEQGFPAGPPRPPVPATALALGGPPQTVPAPIPPPPQGAGLYPSTSMTPSPAADAFGRRDRGLMGKVGGALAAIGAFLAKGGWLLLTHLKFLAVAATMLISIAAYSLFFGWTFAAAFVIVILIHEMGHVVQLRREGVRATPPMFIPFLGAVVGMREMPKDAGAEARVGLAGPVAGTIASLVALAIYLDTGNVFWKALAGIGFFLQLFNLIPALPLDGGRASAALSPKIWWVGLPAVALLAVWEATHGYGGYFILILVLILGVREMRRRKAREATAEGRAYYDSVRPRTRVAVGLVYLTLILGTGVATLAYYAPQSIYDATHHIAPSAQTGQ